MRIEVRMTTFAALKEKVPVALIAAYLATSVIDIVCGWHLGVFVLMLGAVWTLYDNVDVTMPWWSPMRTTRHRLQRRRNAEGWTRIADIRDRSDGRLVLRVYARFMTTPQDGDASATLAVALKSGSGDRYLSTGDRAPTLEIDAEGDGGLDLSDFVDGIDDLRLRIRVGAATQTFKASFGDAKMRTKPTVPVFAGGDETPEMAIVRDFIATAPRTNASDREISVLRRRIASQIHPDRGTPERRTAREAALKAANAHLDLLRM